MTRGFGLLATFMGVAALAGSVLLVDFAQGQTASTQLNRDCQTLRTCNFKRGGDFRGCISAYSCRTCKLVPSRCTITGAERVCQKMQCTWG